MENLCLKFLAKNKYPKVKESMRKTDLNEVWSEDDFNDDNIKSIEEKQLKTSNDLILLTLYYLGWRSGKINAHKARYWAEQNMQDEFGIILLLISHISDESMTYKEFDQLYQTYMTNMVKIKFSSSELFYRLIKLLIGWTKDYLELELSQDLFELSKLVAAPSYDQLKMDQLINKWMIYGRKNELKLLHSLIGQHDKIEHLID